MPRPKARPSIIAKAEAPVREAELRSAGEIDARAITDHSHFKRGLDLFNRGHFFDAHEVLEDLWRSLPRHSAANKRFRLHVQGMIQLAVAFHHESTGNRVGALSVLKRALRNLKGAERSFARLDFDQLRRESALWEAYLHRSLELVLVANENKNRRHLAPALPKIHLRG